MIKRLFVPLDGSAEAESVLPWLKAWNLNSSRLILFHCLASRLPKGETVGHSRFETVEEAQKYLETVARTLPGEAQVVVRSGFPGDRIVTSALQAEADLVVMSYSGDYGAPRTLGKVTEKVAQTCPLPVLLIKTPVGFSFRRIRRILVPLDRNARGDENLDVIQGIAGDLQAEVILLHVGSPETETVAGEPGLRNGSSRSETTLPPVPQVWQPLKDGLPVSDVRLNLIHQVWSFLRKEIAARTVMTKGSFVEETLSHERSLDADIVAVARDGSGAGRSWNAILRQAERAVLLHEVRDPNASGVVPVLRDRVLSAP